MSNHDRIRRQQLVMQAEGYLELGMPQHGLDVLARWGDPDTRDFMTLLNANVPLDARETRFFYAFGGFSRREANSAGFYRRANDTRNWPEIYPLGFLPEIQPTVVDLSAAAGVRGAWNQWAWDLSGEYGHNTFDFTVGNSLNVSLGPTIPPNQTEFYAGSFVFDQWVGNLDITRPFSVGAIDRLNVAFGAEWRRENYQIIAGEPNSYLDGGHPNRFGGRAVPGAQVSVQDIRFDDPSGGVRDGTTDVAIGVAGMAPMLFSCGSSLTFATGSLPAPVI